MSTVAKILVVLNLGLAIFFLATASNFLGQQDNYKTKLAQQEERYTTDISLKESENQELRGRLGAAQGEINKLAKEREVAQAENGRITAEVTHLREAYNQLSASSTKSTRSVEQLTNSLNASRDMNANLQTSNNNLRDALKQAQDDRDAKVAQVNSLQQSLDNETENRKGLESTLASARENIERQDFKLRWYADRFPGAVASAQPAHTGQILAADNKANVYVISLGEEDGVKAGFTYIVSRGGQYIATIQISDVQAKQAAGSAIKDISKGSIRRGDKVMNGQ